MFGAKDFAALPTNQKSFLACSNDGFCIFFWLLQILVV